MRGGRCVGGRGRDSLGFQAPVSLWKQSDAGSTGDWPGWPPVNVAKRPEHTVWGERMELVSITPQKGTWGVSPEQER